MIWSELFKPPFIDLKRTSKLVQSTVIEVKCLQVHLLFILALCMINARVQQRHKKFELCYQLMHILFVYYYTDITRENVFKSHFIASVLNGFSYELL